MLLSDSPILIFHIYSREGIMKRKELKKLLAGMGIAGLIGAGGIAVPGGSIAASSG